MPEAFEVWIRRLRDPNMETRREAIRQLEAFGRVEALGPLAHIFALDPDLETRKLAQWAGKSIYQAFQRRAVQVDETASAEERRKAAEIYAKAQSKKTHTPRR